MPKRLSRLLIVAPLVAAVLPVTGARVSAVAGQGQQIALSPWLSPPAAIDTSGDYATDTFSDPWDFSNDADINPVLDAGGSATTAVSYSGGVFTATTHNTAEIRLLMNWSQTSPVLPWGHDGWRHPIDGGKYSIVDMKIKTDVSLFFAIRWWNAAGQEGLIPIVLRAGDWQTLHYDLNDRSLYPGPEGNAVWGGPIVRFELFRGSAVAGGDPAANVSLDWVRLHRPDAPTTPPDTPIPQVITPNEDGGADYATTVRGNPWDFAGMDDVSDSHDVTALSTASGDLTGTTTGNDPYIAMPVDGGLLTDKYHHFTADVCYTGGFSLSGAPGGGMVGRIAWIKAGSRQWSDSQDIIVYPGVGCNHIDLDLVTTPALALHDENGSNPIGWRGVPITQFRFDLDEDPGARAFTLKNIKLSDDAAFTSSYDITYADAASAPSAATADIYATTVQGDYGGTKIASGLSVGAGTNTFHWTGADANGTAMPNATYWIYVVMHNRSGNGVGYSTGPVRLERAVPQTPSYYVPLTPARLLDTRDGEGGNLSPLAGDVTTQLLVAGVGGVPASGATAVVMNLTAVNPTDAGFLTAYPSGEPRPLVSNVNFVPGQTVPNLTTVKLGANGRVDIYNHSGETDVIADVVGYYTDVPPPAGGRFTALTPARILDTRSGVGAPATPIRQDQAINLTVTGVGGVPATGVQGVALNVTAADPTGQGFITAWPTGAARPNASSLNFVPGLTVANMVIAKVGDGGQVSLYNSSGNSQLVADVTGYFSSTGGLFVPVTPQRLIDTRDGTGGMAGMVQGMTETMSVANGSPVPAKAAAVVVNVTSVDTEATGYMTVWPTGDDRPGASTLNPRPGVAVPNLAYLKVGKNGTLSIFNANGANNVVVDVFGYVM